MPFQHTTNKIIELDKAIQVIELLQINELKNIQLNEDLKNKSEIICQTDYEIEDFNANDIIAETNTFKLVKDKDQKQMQNQYSTSDFSVLKAFLTNLTSM